MEAAAKILEFDVHNGFAVPFQVFFNFLDVLLGDLDDFVFGESILPDDFKLF